MSDGSSWLRLYGPVGCLAGAVIALQIAVMRIFAVGGWSHFGSLVVSLAMLGFGLASVLIFAAGAALDRYGTGAASVSLVAFGPLAVGSNQVAQLVPFNPIFLISDPAQKWWLLDDFLLYLLPFLTGALFLGIVFRQGRHRFNRLYFADLVGSGIAGAGILFSMYLLPPEQILVAPLSLWAVALVLWFGVRRMLWTVAGAGIVISAYLAIPGLLDVPAIAISQYKGISYARNFPDAKRVYRSFSPFGDLQVYASSYMHFAPGLSDNAAFNVPELPPNTYVGMYNDGDGPRGIMKSIPKPDQAYFQYLPMYYPYVIKHDANVFVVQLGGGISTRTALAAGARSVTVAESNPDVLRAFRNPKLRVATGAILSDPRVRVVGEPGRLYLSHSGQHFDVIDLSLANSVGLSNPGGSAINESYAYTEQALRRYMRALAPGGILAVTVWNKQEPPKSTLRLFATASAAAREIGGNPAQSFFVAQSYLSTSTVLYKKGGFTSAEIAELRRQTRDLSFDEIYSPGFKVDPTATAGLIAKFRDSIFGNESSGLTASGADKSGGATSGGSTQATSSDVTPADGSTVEPSTQLARLFWHDLMTGQGAKVLRSYVFDVHPMTDDRPYFAGYIRLSDLRKTLNRLDIVQDDWGYLLLWATLGVSALTATSLIIAPVLLGGRQMLQRGSQFGAILIYFGCLGVGYITVEVGLIGWLTRALVNPTISAAVVISAMLVFSGLGSYAAERIVARPRVALPVILGSAALILGSMPFWLPGELSTIGTLPMSVRIACSVGIVAPPAFLMGFPMATAMTWLGQTGRERSFVWAWGVNGCFSVVGAAAVPLIEVLFGLSAVLNLGASVYAMAIPAFLAMIGRSRVNAGTVAEPI